MKKILMSFCTVLLFFNINGMKRSHSIPGQTIDFSKDIKIENLRSSYEALVNYKKCDGWLLTLTQRLLNAFGNGKEYRQSLKSKTAPVENAELIYSRLITLIFASAEELKKRENDLKKLPVNSVGLNDALVKISQL